MSTPPGPQPTADRSPWVNLVILAVLALAVFVIFRFRPFGDPNAENHPAVGKKLPVVELQPLTGDAKPVVREDLKGKVVLLNFWATWCPPCREELPHMAAIADEFAKEPDFKLLAVSCGQAGADDLETLRRGTETLLSSLTLHMPTYADPTGATQASFQAVAGFQSLPTTYLLDRQGTIRAVWEGYRPGIETEMKDLVTQLLQEQE